MLDEIRLTQVVDNVGTKWYNLVMKTKGRNRMSHKKSKKVYWCHTNQHEIMASFCEKCEKRSLWSGECPQGNFFNSCKIISENQKKDIDKAFK